MVAGPGSALLEHEHQHGPGEEHDPHGFAAVAAAVHGGERARKLRKALRLAVFGLAALTLAAELVLRFTNARARALEPAPGADATWMGVRRAPLFEEVGDPARRYALSPGAEAEVDGHRYRISSRGTRGPEIPAAKPANERRLLCLGDAAAFGLGCDEDETLASLLAARASAREAELGSGRTWRAVDLGVPGYELEQTLRAFEDGGPALQPDLVVLVLTTNEIDRTGFRYDPELGLRRDFLPLPESLKRSLWRWSHLYGWIAALHARAAEDGPRPELEPRVPWAPVRPDNQAHARAALARLAELCRARGVPLFVIAQPLLDSRDEARRVDWPGLPLDAWFRGVCSDLGLPALHLLGWLRGYADGVDRTETGAPPDDATDEYVVGARERRLSSAGYASVARLAHERLRAEGLLP
jgi:hypothetical protein